MRNIDQGSDHAAAPDIPVAEWIAAALGLAIVLIAIAFLSYQAIHGASLPPEITVAVRSIEPQQSGYLVQARVINTGRATASQLIVEGTLMTTTGEEQRSQVTLDYLPGGSERRAGLFFTTDPRKGKLQIRAIGYQDP
jgi:uncharacterized protein (TIGR02588 family)